MDGSMDENWMRLLARATTRRGFLRSSAGFGVLWLGLDRAVGPFGSPRFRAHPFTLGVASGEPEPRGIVLWTRLAPEPLITGGGMPAEPVRVEWEVALDETFARIVRRGSVAARPEFAHSVHVEVDRLEPDRVYWYRFMSGGESSPVGRTRTAPRNGERITELPFAFASCQHYEQGLFTALHHLSNEDIRFVVHLGDYIYENGGVDDRPRRHDAGEIFTVDDYRRRYALYKLDEHLQAAHASLPWIVTWDDHEVDNNYADGHDERGSPVDQFLLRRAAAYQAYYEHLPLRRSAVPRGPDARIYRRLAFGSLIDLHVMDTRQYRTDQPCGDGRQPRCAGALDPAATVMGREQEKWLTEGLDRSNARWNVLANQVPMAPVDNEPGDAASYSMDRWDGYVAARARVMEFLNRRQPSNPVVLTGDIHSNWVAELKADFDVAESPTVGIEFITTSLSSGGDGADTSEFGRRALEANPHMRFFNNQRGYVRCTVTPDAWRADYRVLAYVTRPGSPVTTRASFVVEAGRPGVQRDSG